MEKRNAGSIVTCIPVAVAAGLTAAAMPALAQRTLLPEVVVEGARETPLNTESPAESATRLGLPVREIPATVEVITQDTLKQRGLRTTTEAVQSTVGVTGGDAPGAPASFSMRGFTFGQITTLYNGIKIGPSSMTSRVMDTGNLDRIEFLMGPASLMSGEGATGGAINFVTRRPHQGAIENEAFLSYGSFDTIRGGVGSGGSTAIQGLDYRFDLTGASSAGFIDDTRSENWHLSAGLDFRASGDLKLFGAFEYLKDRAKAYWGTPLVPASDPTLAPRGGIVSGVSTASISGNDLGAVAIDGRTLKTNYNAVNNNNEADQYWLRGGFEWRLGEGLTLRDQLYYYTAKREFFNNETYSFDPASGLVDRDRFFVSHDQDLIGNKAELQWDARPGGMDNRLVLALEWSQYQFDPTQSFDSSSSVTLVNPIRGALTGPLPLTYFTSRVENTALAVEDRLKITPAFALVGGLRYDDIALDRNSTDSNGAVRAGYPFSTKFHPVTGRVGFTWETMPGFMLFGQYATAADVGAAANIFTLRSTQPQDLTRVRTYEAGIKHLLWERKAEWTLSLFDIERKNVPSDQAGHLLNIVGKQVSSGVELAAAVRPTREWSLWANFAHVRARYEDYDFDGGSFTGHTPPNVPEVVANAGASYRFATALPLEIGASVRHVGERFNSDANTVTMQAYTAADAYAFVDLKRTRITLRVRNLTDRKYAVWSDPGYPDQVLLGAPRSYEIAAAIRF